MKTMSTILTICLLSGLITFAQDSTYLNPIISDFQVNENAGPSGARQYFPDVSKAGDGSYVVTWVDRRDIGPNIYAQQYLSDGTPIGSNFKVNDKQGDVSQPSVSTDGNRNFVVTWANLTNYDHSYTDSLDIYAQRYSSDGTALGSNFKVNDVTGFAVVGSPSISLDMKGNFVITWEYYREDDGSDIYAQRYSNDGVPAGSNFKINSNENNYATSPSISMDGNGSFVITWKYEKYDYYLTGNYDIYAQRYSSTGTALENNFKVNNEIKSPGYSRPAVSMNYNGNFVIAWEVRRNGGSDIYAQRYSNDGSILGNNFKINEANYSGFSPSISIDSSGNFYCAWCSGNSFSDVYAQQFLNDGTRLGNNFKVNNEKGSPGWDDDFITCISSDPSGNFIIVWRDYRNGKPDIYGQQYLSDGTELGSNFRINDDFGSASQRYSRISVDGEGDFVVIWSDERNGSYDIFAQRYSKDGLGLGNNFNVNNEYGQRNPRSFNVASDTSGNFVIAWVGEDNYQLNVYAQRYSNEGIALGDNFKVNNGEGIPHWNYGFIVDVAIDNAGNFGVIWQDISNDDIDNYAQKYSTDGTALGSNFKVTGGWHSFISSYESGNYVITWRYPDLDSYDFIYAQRYSNNGTEIGSRIEINKDIRTRSSTSWDIFGESVPTAASDTNGDFIITWADGNYQKNEYYIYARRYSSDGNPLGNKFKVTETNKKIRFSPDVKLCNNKIYNTWTDTRGDGTGYDIWANVIDWNVTDIEEEHEKIPSKFKLCQNYPNPFNPTTTIKYSIPNRTHPLIPSREEKERSGRGVLVTLKVYDILGREIAALVNKKQNSGSYKVSFDASNLTSGIYFYKIQAGDFVETKKMVLLQ